MSNAMRHRLSLSFFLFALLPALAIGQGRNDLTTTLTPVLPRTQAKDFALPDLDGKTQRLSGFRGKVVLLNFWGSWCPPCRREMPSMERLYQHLKDQPFTILAVNQAESSDMVFAYTSEIEPAPTFPMLLDTQEKIPPQWKVRGLPASFIIDKQGRVAYRAMGGREFDHPDIENKIRALIAE